MDNFNIMVINMKSLKRSEKSFDFDGISIGRVTIKLILTSMQYNGFIRCVGEAIGWWNLSCILKKHIENLQTNSFNLEVLEEFSSSKDSIITDIAFHLTAFNYFFFKLLFTPLHSSLICNVIIQTMESWIRDFQKAPDQCNYFQIHQGQVQEQLVDMNLGRK